VVVLVVVVITDTLSVILVLSVEETAKLAVLLLVVLDLLVVVVFLVFLGLLVVLTKERESPLLVLLRLGPVGSLVILSELVLVVASLIQLVSSVGSSANSSSASESLLVVRVRCSLVGTCLITRTAAVGFCVAEGLITVASLVQLVGAISTSTSGAGASKTLLVMGAGCSLVGSHLLTGAGGMRVCVPGGIVAVASVEESATLQSTAGVVSSLCRAGVYISVTSGFVFRATMANYGVVNTSLAGEVAPVRVLLGRWCKRIRLSHCAGLSCSVQSVVSSTTESIVASVAKGLVASLRHVLLARLVGSTVLRAGHSEA